MRVSPNFLAQEFIGKDHFNHLRSKYEDDSKLEHAFYRYIDRDTVKVAQNIRNHIDTSMTINDWFYGGKFENRGYREPSFYNNQRFKISQHQRGLAIDFHCEKYSPKQIRNKIIPHWKDLGFNRIEMDVNWVHVDLCKTGLDDLVKFYP